MPALPGAVLLDTSVLLRLFVDHDDDLREVVSHLERAWRDDRLQLVVLDLSVYELVNVAVRRLGFDATRARQAVGGVYALRAPMITLDRSLAEDAAAIAADSGLSGYDAAFLAAARRAGVALLTGDRRLAEQDGAIALASVEP